MISKAKISYLRSLQDKTTRYQEGVFIVEGRKSMLEYMDSDLEIIEGFFTEKFSEGNEFGFPISLVSESELSRITTLNTNDSGILLIKMRENKLPKIQKNELILVLDTINDPGNLGTVIRIADWYGISHIIASRDTVDCYNPKVIMATMGSFARISIFYTDLDLYLSKISGKVYGAYLDGESTHTKKFDSTGGYLVIGSEAHGITAELEKYVTDKITIPRFGLAESLNAGVATAVILDRMV
ncbi:RNA methyltransferase [Candidatus Gracilibacteria bacterium]|nr:RNA methyltransferase [Candidatus Gracilibacteria bacterium]